MHMLSFIVRLFKLKCMYGLSNSALEAILHLFSLVLPEGHCIPNTLDKVQKVVRDLGHRLRFLLQNVSNATHHCVAKTIFLATKQKNAAQSFNHATICHDCQRPSRRGNLDKLQ